MENLKRLADLLISKKLTLATAESCTGGLVGNMITDLPGSSVYYPGGVISYSNRSKIDLLGVLEITLDTYGAVSEQTAREMAEGAKGKFKSDLAVSITGIAGPDSVSNEKPVGLTYIAISSDQKTICNKYHWQGARRENKIKSAEAAIDLLVSFLII